MADCTAQERRAAGSSLSVALNPSGQVCAVQAGGGFGLHLKRVAEMTQLAATLCAELHREASVAISRALQEADDRRWPMGEGTALGLLA